MENCLKKFFCGNLNILIPTWLILYLCANKTDFVDIHKHIHLLFADVSPANTSVNTTVVQVPPQNAQPGNTPRQGGNSAATAPPSPNGGQQQSTSQAHPIAGETNEPTDVNMFNFDVMDDPAMEVDLHVAGQGDSEVRK